MNKIKPFRLFESKIDNLQDISHDCVDIMQELEDSGFRILVSTTIEDSNRLRITCKIARLNAFRWGRYNVVDVYDRLNDYLSIYGFTEISRSVGNVGNFPIVDGMYEASIIFEENK